MTMHKPPQDIIAPDSLTDLPEDDISLVQTPQEKHAGDSEAAVQPDAGFSPACPENPSRCSSGKKIPRLHLEDIQDQEQSPNLHKSRYPLCEEGRTNSAPVYTWSEKLPLCRQWAENGDPLSHTCFIAFLILAVLFLLVAVLGPGSGLINESIADPVMVVLLVGILFLLGYGSKLSGSCESKFWVCLSLLPLSSSILRHLLLSTPLRVKEKDPLICTYHDAIAALGESRYADALRQLEAILADGQCDHEGKLRINALIGYIFLKLNQPDTAKSYLDHAMDSVPQPSHYSPVASVVQLLLALYDLYTGDPQHCVQIAREQEAQAEAQNNWEFLTAAKQLQAVAAAQMEDFSGAEAMYQEILDMYQVFWTDPPLLKRLATYAENIQSPFLHDPAPAELARSAEYAAVFHQVHLTFALMAHTVEVSDGPSQSGRRVLPTPAYCILFNNRTKIPLPPRPKVKPSILQRFQSAWWAFTEVYGYKVPVDSRLFEAIEFAKKSARETGKTAPDPWVAAFHLANQKPDETVYGSDGHRFYVHPQFI